MSFDYLDSVNSKYNEFFEAYDQAEKVILSAPDLHVAEGGSALERTVVTRVVPLLDPIISRAQRE